MAFERSTIEAMCHQEDSGYHVGNYLSQQQPLLGNKKTIIVDCDCRMKMVDWCYQVSNFCHFESDTVEIAISYLDRFLASPSGLSALTDRTMFQLAAMTSLYMAVKVHEREAMDPVLISKLSRGTYTVQQVERMERSMLEALEWRMNPPTTLSFVRHLLEFLPPILKTVQDSVYALAKIQTQLAVRDYKYIMVKSSAIALAAIMNSIDCFCLDNDNDDSMYAQIGEVLAKIVNTDLYSAEFSALKRCLYSSAVSSERSRFFDVANNNNNSSTKTHPRISNGKLYCFSSSLDVSPRSLTAT